MATTPISVAIVGATGAIGARAVHHLLAEQRVARVTALGRRSLASTSERLTSVVVDLADAAAVAAAIPADVDVAICCLGTTMKVAGSKAAFRAIDHDAVVTFAAAAAGHGAKRFILVSSAGAKASSMNFYLRTKGEAEDAVVALGFAHVALLRPSILDDEGARGGSRLGERIGLAAMRGVAAIVGRQHRISPISVDIVGRAIAALVRDDATTERRRVVESDGLHRLGAQ